MATAAPPESSSAARASSAAGHGPLALPARWLGRHPVLASQLRGFAVVAVICTVISMAIFASLRPLTGTQWANAISLILCSVLNTELNRRMSFGIRGRHLWWRDQRRGLWVMLLALAMTSGSLVLLHQVLPDASITLELLVIVLGNVASAVTRFLLLRYWIFRRLRRGSTPVPGH
ncbi:GtrA family protein [Arthrobacter sp. H35-D1]|uniref:GtrA family protein n=1 Tax=Arthrobacter sp. H35-D1 TaxID=3046202 RepID=UPI0024BB5E31|nr:GtrA family protein [Arthrobacter sp. H35-D1]MDJ0313141.1 GtrA family protein [Arthrobacter sp. H35-D1]